MKFPDGLRICGASSVCCDGTFCTPSVTGLTSSLFFSFSATSGVGGASSSCIFRSSAASSDFNRFSSSSFFHTLPAISCNCGISRSSTSFFALYWLMVEGIFSSAFRKFVRRLPGQPSPNARCCRCTCSYPPPRSGCR